MNRTRLKLLAAVMCAVPLTAHAAPEVKVISKGDAWSGSCGFAGDAVALIVSEGARQIAEQDYCSSYGRSSAQIVSDRLGRNYIAVEYGEGHGTLAVTTYLLIYYLDGNNLNEIARVPISWATGANGDWVFEYSFDQLQSGGLQVNFRRLGNGEGDECCTLPERTLVLTLRPQ